MKLTTTGQVSDCLSAYVASAALGAAIEVGLFWLLAEQPLDAPGVAQALTIPVHRCQYWLQLLHSIGVVDQVPAGYAPSDLARSAILDTYSQESWAFLAQEDREKLPSVCDIGFFQEELCRKLWAALGAEPDPNRRTNKTELNKGVLWTSFLT